MPTHYVLIDYQNVQPTDLSVLNPVQFHVAVFIGEDRSTLRTDLVLAMQKLGPRGEFIQLTSQGPNALDFHIAFYMGRLAEQDPTACFNVISEDKGFDPLIQHLQQRGIHARRVADLSAITLRTAPKDAQDPFTRVVENLERRRATRPRTMDKLTNTIATILQKQRDSAEVAAVVKRLKSEKYFIIQGTAVVYAQAT